MVSERERREVYPYSGVVYTVEDTVCVCVVADEETNFQSRLEEEGIHEKILKVPHRPQHRHLSHPQRTKTNLTLLV